MTPAVRESGIPEATDLPVLPAMDYHSSLRMKLVTKGISSTIIGFLKNSKEIKDSTIPQMQKYQQLTHQTVIVDAVESS